MALPQTTWASLLAANSLSLKMQILRCIEMVKPKATLSMEFPRQTFFLFQDSHLLGSQAKDAGILDDAG